MDLQTMQLMKQVDIRNVDKNALVDLSTVHIDDTAPVTERIEKFIQQIRNPYCFRIGDVAVKVNYKENGPSFQQNIEDLLRIM
ncbi:hypothetical protein D3Z47_02005 [Lachnospiraceae bacterium]|nr:hypothetical protein [Lachnospiraceae bacterium]